MTTMGSVGGEREREVIEPAALLAQRLDQSDALSWIPWLFGSSPSRIHTIPAMIRAAVPSTPIARPERGPVLDPLSLAAD